MVVASKDAWIPRRGRFSIGRIPGTIDRLLNRYAPYVSRVPIAENVNVRSLARSIARGDCGEADRLVRSQLAAGLTPGAIMLALVLRSAHHLDLDLVAHGSSEAEHVLGITGLRRLIHTLARRVPAVRAPREERVGIYSFRGGRATLGPMVHAIYAGFAGWRVELAEGVTPQDGIAAIKADPPDVLLCRVGRSADVKSARAMQRVCGAKCFVIGSPIDAAYLRRAAPRSSRILFDPRETLDLLERLNRRQAH